MCWVELFVKCSFKEREAIYCCDLHSVPECFSNEIFFLFLFNIFGCKICLESS